MKYPNVAAAVYGECWAIVPEKLEAIVALIEFRRAGGHYSAEQIAQQIGAKRGTVPQASGDIAIIPIFGVLAQHMDAMEESSGGISTERVSAMFDQAMNHPKVGGIVLNINSPGGSVHGIQTLADKIFGARGKKPIVAVANSLAASAAYWIASAADRIFADPGAEVGSVGVVAMHVDQSSFNEKMGIKPTLVTAGRFKGEGSPHVPLDDVALSNLQAKVDGYYEQFISALSRNRNKSKTYIRENYGEGRTLSASAAESAGMIEGIKSLDAVLSEMQGGKSKRGMAAAGFPAKTARAMHEQAAAR